MPLLTVISIPFCFIIRRPTRLIMNTLVRRRPFLTRCREARALRFVWCADRQLQLIRRLFGGAGGLGSWSWSRRSYTSLSTSPGRSPQSRTQCDGSRRMRGRRHGDEYAPYRSRLEPAIGGLITNSTAASRHLRPEGAVPLATWNRKNTIDFDTLPADRMRLPDSGLRTLTSASRATHACPDA
jgi:hypothetical protein